MFRQRQSRIRNKFSREHFLFTVLLLSLFTDNCLDALSALEKRIQFNRQRVLQRQLIGKQQQKRSDNVVEPQRPAAGVASGSSASLPAHRIMLTFTTPDPRLPVGERCWDPFLKRFYLGTFENCENELDNAVCDELFPADLEKNLQRVADGQPPIAHENCGRPEMEERATQCAKNCYNCCLRPEFACKNPRPSANFHCEDKVAKCRSRLWVDVMREKCPRTCGLCNYDRPTNDECRDSDVFCQDGDISLLCGDPRLAPRMALLCPKTCGTCDRLIQK